VSGAPWRPTGYGPAARGHRLRRRRAVAEGFTLLEVLVVMVLLGLIVTAGFGALRLTGRSWEAGIAAGQRIDAQTSGPAYLGRQVAQVVAPLWRVQGKVRLPFEGEAERLRFLGPAPTSDAQTGLYVVTLEGEAGYGEGRLLLRMDRFDPTRQDLGEPSADEPIVLLEGLRETSLEYYGLPRPGAEEAWLTRWPEDAQSLPQLMRVRVRPAGGGPTYDLVYPLRVSAPR